jgi:hypothetical protein
VSGRLGEPEPFLPEDATLGEHPQLGMARGEVGAGVHCGHEDVTEALVAARLIKRRHDLLHAGNRPTIVALFLTGSAQVEVRQRLQAAVPTGRGEREGALGGSRGLVMRPQHAEMF